MRALLGIPRPRTRGECLEEARPCPWVGCKHHLLIEVLREGAGGLVLNQPRRPGRRRALRSSAAAALVGVWIDDAIELLAAMPSGCSLDVADLGPQARMDVADQVGLSREGVRQERRRAIAVMARARSLAQAEPDHASGT